MISKMQEEFSKKSKFFKVFFYGDDRGESVAEWGKIIYNNVKPGMAFF